MLCREFVLLAAFGIVARPAMAAGGPADLRSFRLADRLHGGWDVVVGDQTLPGRFDLPTGIAVDSDGSAYVADTRNHRVQKLSPAGEPIAVLGSEGDGPGQFRAPTGLAIDGQGSVYVSDAERHDVQKLAPSGHPLARWGGEGSEPGRFRSPLGIALSPGGELFVADSQNRRIQKLGSDDRVEAIWSTDEFMPTAVGIAPDRTLYVTERMSIGGAKTTFHARVRHYDAGGTVLATLTGVTWPDAVAIGPDGVIHVADNGHFVGDPFGVRKLLPSGEGAGVFGGLGAEPGQFLGAGGVAFDARGRLYVTDMGNGRVQVLGPNGDLVDAWGVQAIRPTALTSTGDDTLLVLDGRADRVYAVSPPGVPVARWSRGWRDGRGIAWDVDRLLVADAGNHSVIGLTGPDESTVILGARGSGPGELDLPIGIAVDSVGFIYVADTLNDQVQKLSRDGESQAVWDVRFGATVARPVAVAVGADGTVFVADEFNDRVLKLAGDGSLLASIGERGAGSGQLSRPVGLSLAPDGTLYVAESGNTRVQAFAADGTVLGLLGGAADAGGPFKRVDAVAVDASGRVYVADSDSARVYRFTPASR